MVTILLNIFLLKVNFDKSTIGLYFQLISSILAKFLKNQISIAMSSINCLNCIFFSLKLCIKYKLINHIVNNIWLTQNLTYVLKV